MIPAREEVKRILNVLGAAAQLELVNNSIVDVPLTKVCIFIYNS